MDAIANALGSWVRHEIEQELRVERAALAAKIRVTRAILVLSQEELARRIGVTQRSIHRIEQGLAQPKRKTMIMIERFWAEQAITFENMRNGGFRLVVDSNLLG